MRVLMLAPEPILEPRGTPISVYQRTLGLASLGHTVDLVTYHVGQDIAIRGVAVHRTPRLPFIKKVKVGPSWAKLPLDILVFFKAFSLLATKRYDVIHSHEEASFLALPLAAIFRTRHVYDMHSSLPRQLENFRFGNVRPIVELFEMLEWAVISRCNAMITIGSDLERHARKVKPSINQVMIENMPVQNVTPAVDRRSVDELRDRLGLRGKVPVVYIGTFERYQGIDLLLESAALVRQRHPEVVFVLVGGKPEQVEHWQDRARQLQLDDCIRFVGTVPIEETGKFLSLAEILVSSRTEGTSVPLKIYSYLYSGKPTVATRLTSHTLVLTDDIAVLVEPTSTAFADGISQLVRDEELRRSIGNRARAFAEERYGFEAYVAKLDRLYKTLEPPAPELASPSRPVGA